MDLRHLRCFIAVAEERSFTRAAERLHIEQSPVSRAIKELEDELGTLLFERDRRGTRLTPAGVVFLQDVRRLFCTLEQARENVKAVATGHSGSLHVGISGCAIDPRLSDLLARCREEDPEIEIRLSEVPVPDLLHGLRSGDFSIGFSHTSDVGDDIISEPLWNVPLIAAVPARHPILIHKELPLDELVQFPLILCSPQACDGSCKELTRELCAQGHDLKIAERVISWDMMLTLVSAGIGIGFTSAARMTTCRYPNIVPRPLATDSATATTYLLRPDSDTPSIQVERFMRRLHVQVED
ncbi:TPA: LysR family transcriptional regulator [Pseudomonas aeruginosa]|uniref:LysR family transcriptional regulator n=1 Tax=Pseudomonas synxantha TaxID=47883 RepID=A0ABS0UDH9_9PSED|nr:MULTISPECIES: LysR family transcriptional regulator [Pseudomonas]MBI6563364.1 LysR family transcriptional regulator [Pseudomonas synxantha]MBI6580673.1 LysR family transcriptional regulator [Pseudomonas synxantha]MBI6642812.1 LysR family transcriptional regulator [Pseudomonas synxantha]HCF1528806.1 LysR family transcriptional regulator [Pseudomonas aeruginosa]